MLKIHNREFLTFAQSPGQRREGTQKHCNALWPKEIDAQCAHTVAEASLSVEEHASAVLAQQNRDAPR